MGIDAVVLNRESADKEDGVKNELWLGEGRSGVRLAIRPAPSGEMKVSIRTTNYREEAWLSREECRKILGLSSVDAGAELRLHPEGFGGLSFDVCDNRFGIDHHEFYRWTKETERECIWAFLRLFVERTS